MHKCLKRKGDGMRMSKAKEKQGSIFQIVKYLLPKIASVNKKQFLIIYILFIIDGLLLASSMAVLQGVFDCVGLLNEEKSQFQTVIFLLLGLLIIKLTNEIVNGIAYCLAEDYDNQSIQALTYQLNEKVMKLNPIFFEEKEQLDTIEKAYNGILVSVHFMNTLMDTVFVYSPYFIFIGIYLAYLNPMLMIALIFIFLPVLLGQKLKIKQYGSLENTVAPLRRQVEYYGDCLASTEYLKETRMLGATPYFLRLLKQSIDTMNQEAWKTDKKANLIELAIKNISLIGYIAILVLLFISILNHSIGSGAFVVIFSYIDKMFQMMEEVIGKRLGNISANISKIENYITFMEYEQENNKTGNNQSYNTKNKGEIKLKDVWFSYPNRNSFALKGINLTIKQGEIVAIVGENGSGKSTLVRILSGLYEATKGTVQNTFLSKEDENHYENVSCVFQDFQRYKCSLEENITISDKRNKNEKKRLQQVMEFSELTVDENTFPYGYQTILSREFGGVDLSGGQWQRIAIARGYYKNSELFILDEPTSAIDPMEEIRVYEMLSQMVVEKTAFIVTHRLGAIRFATKIIVMENGQILDIGSHNELLQRCNQYKNMWNTQLKVYEKL